MANERNIPLKTKILILFNLLAFFFVSALIFQPTIKSNASSPNINQRLQQTRSQLQDISQRRTDLQAEVNRMQSKIEEVEGIIQESEKEIARMAKEIEENEEEIEELKKETRKILREMQVLGGNNLIENILSAQNLSQLLNQVYIFSSRHDRLQENSLQLDVANQRMQDKIKKQEKTKTEAKETKLALELSKEEKDYLLVHFQGKENQFKTQVSSLQAQQNQIQSSTETSSAPPTQVSNSGFIWPAQGIITRCVVGGHIGCDIANASAPNLFAAQSGTVSAVYRYTVIGYGLAVVIDHGGGLQTLYAHMNRIDVSAGQQVSQGQVIGQMGCTGFCTGTHLHFEVRQNGVRQDPLRYLPPR